MHQSIVTILSTNYAGSHFLSLLLGSHSRASHVGELRRVVEGRSIWGEVSICHLCNPPLSCPTVRNLNSSDPQSAYSTVIANFAEERRHPDVLIDASKRVTWARRFVRDNTYRYRYIHLIRDPRALVRRDILNYRKLWSRFHARRKAAFRGPRFRPDLILAPIWKVALCKWYNKNMQILEFLRRYELDYQVVTYRDLATDTAGELRRLCPWMGLDFEPEQVEYWNFNHHGSQKITYEWIKQQQKTGHFDVRWKEFLSEETAAAIGNDPDVAHMLGELSLRIDDIGLTRKPAQQMPSTEPLQGEHARRAA